MHNRNTYIHIGIYISLNLKIKGVERKFLEIFFSEKPKSFACLPTMKEISSLLSNSLRQRTPNLFDLKLTKSLNEKPTLRAFSQQNNKLFASTNSRRAMKVQNVSK